MADLSPAAQAVLVAAINDNADTINDPDCDWIQGYSRQIAAALRVAADRIEAESIWIGHAEHSAVRWSAHQLRCLAAELEGSHD